MSRRDYQPVNTPTPGIVAADTAIDVDKPSLGLQITSTLHDYSAHLEEKRLAKVDKDTKDREIAVNQANDLRYARANATLNDRITDQKIRVEQLTPETIQDYSESTFMEEESAWADSYFGGLGLDHNDPRTSQLMSSYYTESSLVKHSIFQKRQGFQDVETATAKRDEVAKFTVDAPYLSKKFSDGELSAGELYIQSFSGLADVSNMTLSNGSPMYTEEEARLVIQDRARILFANVVAGHLSDDQLSNRELGILYENIVVHPEGKTPVPFEFFHVDDDGMPHEFYDLVSAERMYGDDAQSEMDRIFRTEFQRRGILEGQMAVKETDPDLDELIGKIQAVRMSPQSIPEVRVTGIWDGDTVYYSDINGVPRRGRIGGIDFIESDSGIEQAYDFIVGGLSGGVLTVESLDKRDAHQRELINVYDVDENGARRLYATMAIEDGHDQPHDAALQRDPGTYILEGSKTTEHIQARNEQQRDALESYFASKVDPEEEPFDPFVEKDVYLLSQPKTVDLENASEAYDRAKAEYDNEVFEYRARRAALSTTQTEWDFFLATEQKGGSRETMEKVKRLREIRSDIESGVKESGTEYFLSTFAEEFGQMDEMEAIQMASQLTQNFLGLHDGMVIDNSTYRAVQDAFDGNLEHPGSDLQATFDGIKAKYDPKYHDQIFLGMEKKLNEPGLRFFGQAPPAALRAKATGYSVLPDSDPRSKQLLSLAYGFRRDLFESVPNNGAPIDAFLTEVVGLAEHYTAGGMDPASAMNRAQKDLFGDTKMVKVGHNNPISAIVSPEVAKRYDHILGKGKGPAVVMDRAIKSLIGHGELRSMRVKHENTTPFEESAIHDATVARVVERDGLLYVDLYESDGYSLSPAAIVHKMDDGTERMKPISIELDALVSFYGDAEKRTSVTLEGGGDEFKVEGDSYVPRSKGIPPSLRPRSVKHHVKGPPNFPHGSKGWELRGLIEGVM